MGLLRNWLVSRDLKRARALEGEGYAERAATAYADAASRASGEDRVSALLGQARCRLRLGGLAESRAAAGEATKLAPGSADAWHLLGVVQLELRDTVGAEESFHAGLKIAPERPDLLQAQAELYAVKFPRAGLEAGKRVLRTVLGKPAEAERLGFPRELPLVFVRNLAAEQRFHEEACAWFDELAADAAGERGWLKPLALTHKGILLANTGKLDEAVQAHLAALSAAPDFDAAHFNLGMAYARKRDFDGARTAFSQYAKAHPREALATYGFGFVAETKPDVPEMIRLYKFFLERIAQDPPAPRSLGCLDLARGWVEHVRTVVDHAGRHREEGHEEP